MVTCGNHKNDFISWKTKYRLSLAQKHKIQSLHWQAHEQKTQKLKLKLRNKNDHFPVQNQNTEFTYTQTWVRLIQALNPQTDWGWCRLQGKMTVLLTVALMSVGPVSGDVAWHAGLNEGCVGYPALADWGCWVCSWGPHFLLWGHGRGPINEL